MKTQNPFKIGDRVNAYHVNGLTSGNVTQVHGDRILIDDYVSTFHWKQCRRLKKQREIWVAPTYEDALLLNPSVSNYKIQGWIKFVEAKK